MPKVIFLDIETVAEKESLANLSEIDEDYKKLWDKKASFFAKENLTSSELYLKKAGIFAEFAKVVCVSLGYLEEAEDGYALSIKSLYGDDEKSILEELKKILEKSTGYNLCAHNGKEFDFPFLARRFIINRLAVPNVLNNHGKKPWEINFLDTMDLWKFGDYKNFTSLELLAKVLGLENPKNEVSGGDIHGLYYQEKNLEKIKNYCEKDVIVLAKIYLRLVSSDKQIKEKITFH